MKLLIFILALASSIFASESSWGFTVPWRYQTKVDNNKPGAQESYIEFCLKVSLKRFGKPGNFETTCLNWATLATVEDLKKDRSAFTKKLNDKFSEAKQGTANSDSATHATFQALSAKDTQISADLQAAVANMKTIQGAFESGSKAIFETHQQTLVTAVLENPKFEGVRKALKEEIKKELLSELAK